MPQAIPFPQPAARLERRRILNDTTIRSLKPPTTGRVDYFDDLTPGLSLRVTSKNARTWTVFYRNQNGRQKRLTLGRYPAVKLVDARELAREAQRKVAHGGDPVVEKRAARDVLTFGALAKQYIDNYAKPNKRSWQEDERQLNASLLPKWKTRPAAEVSAEDLLAILNAKVRAGAPVAANRLRALVSRVYTFAAEQRLVVATANPVIGVKRPTKETTRDRVLTDDEIRRLWDACATQNAYVCAWFRLRLVTAQRGGELLQMRWQDIDPKSHFWTIPGEFVKNAHGHRVYLNETARKILAGVPKAKKGPKPKKAVWVFPKSLMGDLQARRQASGAEHPRQHRRGTERQREGARSGRRPRSRPPTDCGESDGQWRRPAVCDQSDPESLGREEHHQRLRSIQLRRREAPRDGVLGPTADGGPGE